MHAECNSGLQTRKVKEQKAIHDSIAGIVFMGTPHFGSHLADKTRIQVLKAIGKATFMNAPEKLLKALSAHSNELQDLSTSFEKTTIFTRQEIEMCTYYETKTTKFAGKEEIRQALQASPQPELMKCRSSLGQWPCCII
jgi:tRNA G26 N,N-dimethylase Trm1